MKFFQIVISIAIGLAAGLIPIVGVNLGAGMKNRVRSLFELLIVWELIVGFIALIIVEFFPGTIAAMFGASSESKVSTDFCIK